MTKRHRPRRATGSPNPDLSLDLGRFSASRRADAVSPDEVLVRAPLVEDDTGHRFLVYATEHGMPVDLRYQGHPFWASQGQMAATFGVSQSAISEHVSNVFTEGGLLAAEATHRQIRLVRREGERNVTRAINHYDLNATVTPTS